MFNMKKLIAGAGVVLAAVTMSGCSGEDVGLGGGDSDKEITFFQVPGFDDTTSLSALWQILLEERGITMKVENMDLGPGFTAMTTGEVDGYIDSWLPATHQNYIDPIRDKVKVWDENGPFYENNELVLAVPSYAPDDTIEAAFANADAYGGEIIGIEPGAGLMKNLPNVVETYGATDKITITPGSTPAMLASMEGAIKDKKNVIVALWTPHWAFQKMDIKILEDTKNGWPEADGSYIVTSQKFAEEHAEIGQWMSNMRLTSDQFADIMLHASEGNTPREGMQTWLEKPENRQLTDSWFK